VTTSTWTTTTTTTTLVYNPCTALPVPDFRGSWDTRIGLDDGTYTGDGCGFLGTPTGVTGPLLIGGDSWDVDIATLPYTLPGVSAMIGPLTNFTFATTTFNLDMASIQGGDNYPAKDTRGSLVLAGTTCNPDTDCCLSTELYVYYGASGSYCSPGDLDLDISSASAFLYFTLRCPAGGACNTTLFGNMSRSQ
jgi:hypothetical protein